MQTLSRSLLLAAAAAAFTVLAPSAADAQIGGFIKKKVGDKIADKVLGEQQGAQKKAPKFNEHVLEITGANLDALVKGLDAEAAVQARAGSALRKYEADKAAYEKAIRDMTACHERAGARMNAASQRMMSAAGGNAMQADPKMLEFAQRLAALPPEKRDALQKRMEEGSERMEALMAKGDTAGAARIALALSADAEKEIGMKMPIPKQLQPGLSGQQGAKMAEDMDKAMADYQACPTTAPSEPQRPRELDELRDSVRAAAVGASGLSTAAYSILRERVAAWVAWKDQARQLDQYVFTENEVAVLSDRYPALKGRKDALLATESVAGWQY